MLEIHRATERGHSRYDWLDSRHTFSFGDWHDPARMGFGVLRVINDDRVAPGAGFEPHPHRDMEILSHVLEGSMAHRDSTGGSGLIETGQFQLMSAGSGIVHSEYNASASAPLRFLQIWIRPATRGGAPRYQQRAFARRAGLQPIASPDGREGSLALRQDAVVSRLQLDAGSGELLVPAPGRRLYVHLVEGRLDAAGSVLEAGDALGVAGASSLALGALAGSEALVFELPA